MAKVLILDQSKSMRNTLRERLEYEGFSGINFKLLISWI